MPPRKQAVKDAGGEDDDDAHSGSQEFDDSTQDEDEALDDNGELSSSLLLPSTSRAKRKKERETRSKPKEMTEEEMMDLALRLSEQEASITALRQQKEEEAVMKAIHESMVSQTQPCPASQSQSLLAEASRWTGSRRKLSFPNGRPASDIDQAESEDCTPEIDHLSPGAKRCRDESNNRNKRRKRKAGSPLLEMPDLSQTQMASSQASTPSSECLDLNLDSQQSSESTQIDECQLRKSPVFPLTGCRPKVHVPRLSQDLLESVQTSGFVLCTQDSAISPAQPRNPTFPKSPSCSANHTARPKSPVSSETLPGKDDEDADSSPEYVKSPVFGRNTQREKSPSACKPPSSVCNSGFTFTSQESLTSSVRSASCRPKSPVFPSSPVPSPIEISDSPTFPETDVGQTEQSRGRSPASDTSRRRQAVHPDERRESTGGPAQDSKSKDKQDVRLNRDTDDTEELNETLKDRNSAGTELTGDMRLLWSDSDSDVTPGGSPSPVFPEEKPVCQGDNQAASPSRETGSSPGIGLSCRPSSSSSSGRKQLSTTGREQQPVPSSGPAGQQTVHYYRGVPFCPRGLDPDTYTQVILDLNLDSQQSSESTQIDECQLRKSPVFPLTGCRPKVHVPRLSQDLLESVQTSGFVLCTQDSAISPAQPRNPTFPKSPSCSANHTARPKSPVSSETLPGKDDEDADSSPEYIKSPVFGRNTQREKSPSACKPPSSVCNSGFTFTSQESLTSSVRSASCRPKSPVFPSSPVPSPIEISDSPTFPETDVGQTEQSRGRSPASDTSRRRQAVHPDERRESTGGPAQDSKSKHKQDVRLNRDTDDTEELNETLKDRNSAGTELTGDMRLLWSDSNEDVTPGGSPSPVFPEEKPVCQGDDQAASPSRETGSSPGIGLSCRPSSSSSSGRQQLSTTGREQQPVPSSGPAGQQTVHYYRGVPFCPRGLDPDTYTQSSESTQIDECQLRKSPVFPLTGCRPKVHVPRLSQDLLESVQTSGFVLCTQDSAISPAQPRNPTFPKSPVSSETLPGKDDEDADSSPEYVKSPVFGRNTQRKKSPSACKPPSSDCTSGFTLTSQESLTSSVRSASCRPKSPVFPSSPVPSPIEISDSPTFPETDVGQTEQSRGRSPASDTSRRRQAVHPDERRESTGGPAQDSKSKDKQDVRLNRDTDDTEELNETLKDRNSAETELTSDMRLLWSDSDSDVTPGGSPSPVFPEEKPVCQGDDQAASPSLETGSSPGIGLSCRPSSSSSSGRQQLSTTGREQQPVPSSGPAGQQTVHYYWGVPFCPRGLDPDTYTQVILAQMEVYEKSLKQAQRGLLRKAEWGEAILPQPEKSPSPPESPADSPQPIVSRRRAIRLNRQRLSDAAETPPVEVDDEDDDRGEAKEKKVQEERKGETREEEEKKDEGGEELDTDVCEVCPETQLSDDDRMQDQMMDTDASPQLRPKSPELPEVEMILPDDSPAREEPRDEEMEVDDPADRKTKGSAAAAAAGSSSSDAGLRNEGVEVDMEDTCVEEIKDGGLQRSACPEPAVVPESPETSVDCPICQQSFPVTEIEMHAAYCDGEVAVTATRTPKTNCFQASPKPRRKRTRRGDVMPEDTNDSSNSNNRNREKCFICQRAVPQRDFGRHTELCLQQQTAKTAARGNLLSALEQTDSRDSEPGPSRSRLQTGDVIDLLDDDDEEGEGGGSAAAFSVSNSPIRSFTPISEATGCLIDFKKPPRSKRLVQRRR